MVRRRTNAVSDGTADFSNQKDYGGGGSDVNVGDTSLGCDGRSDGGDATSHALEDLGPHDLDIR